MVKGEFGPGAIGIVLVLDISGVMKKGGHKGDDNISLVEILSGESRAVSESCRGKKSIGGVPKVVVVGCTMTVQGMIPAIDPEDQPERGTHGFEIETGRNEFQDNGDFFKNRLRFFDLDKIMKFDIFEDIPFENLALVHKKLLSKENPPSELENPSFLPMIAAGQERG
jgi:hypothetical protein